MRKAIYGSKKGGNKRKGENGDHQKAITVANKVATSWNTIRLAINHNPLTTSK